MSLFKAAWQQLRTFCGFGHDASYLWPRWVVLRGVGLVYVIIFAGILQEGGALVGPQGLAPIASFCAHVDQVFPNIVVRFLRAPSLFLISSDPMVISAFAWCGLAAAIALVLNLWPRLALFACWALFLSFVATWQEFSPAKIDALMLETALLGIFFAPAGLRPGLGAASPPRPITVLMMRWLIIRIMLTCGLIKVFGGDPHWLDFSFMEKMYETSPAPTILGYYAYHLPHAYHVCEILFTFAAELLMPFVAMFGGRRGRAIAVVVWTIFQLGIQLTGNFGWLNTAAIALGLLFLDDQMIAAGFRRLRLGGWAERLAALARPSPVLPGRRFIVLGTLLWLHFGVTIYYSIVVPRGAWAHGAPDPRTRPVEFLSRDFQSANCYILFGSTPPARDEIEFAGSNDGGVTWRTYPFRYKPQGEDRMPPFLAPRFGRFETTLQIVLNSGLHFSLFPDVARELLQGNSDVIGLFASNPFPDVPPRVVRMMVYRFTYTDLKTHRDTGRYWNKVYVGDYAPPVAAASP